MKLLRVHYTPCCDVVLTVRRERGQLGVTPEPETYVRQNGEWINAVTHYKPSGQTTCSLNDLLEAHQDTTGEE